MEVVHLVARLFLYGIFLNFYAPMAFFSLFLSQILFETVPVRRTDIMPVRRTEMVPFRRTEQRRLVYNHTKLPISS